MNMDLRQNTLVELPFITAGVQMTFLNLKKLIGIRPIAEHINIKIELNKKNKHGKIKVLHEITKHQTGVLDWK